MADAHSAGDMTQRAEAALAAGCDVVLVCNDSEAVAELPDRWPRDGCAGSCGTVGTEGGDATANGGYL
jgi:hypothetical protein